MISAGRKCPARVQTSVVRLAAAVLLLSAGSARSQDQNSGAPAVSVERVREAWRRPQVLEVPPLPDLTPTFRVAVEEKVVPVETVLEGMRREIAERPGSPAAPAGGVDLLGLAMMVVKDINEWRRTRAEAEARQEVERALAEFCASHDCSVTEPGVPPHEGVILPGKAR